MGSVRLIWNETNFKRLVEAEAKRFDTRVPGAASNRLLEAFSFDAANILWGRRKQEGGE
ncbi:MAG: hypothetical protein WCL10_12100 [Novosphingobium sp.]|uniref:hypothetical protein n=1 Tax=Novosphingobium sp. TaxID=1874826 RepID=UPI00301B62E7